MTKNNELTEVEKTDMVEEISHINENLKATLELGGQALEYLERKDKESNAMNVEIRSKEITASLVKQKRVVWLIVYASLVMAALCAVAFATNNAEYVKDILLAAGFLLGGASIPKHLKSD
ncbi:hypothetical protein LC147_18430 [Vibrio harveyi]|uniref:hypothetical protein n=1 Tax=Vibrio harveyi TaxID=669 RepID=UPI003BB67752